MVIDRLKVDTKLQLMRDENNRHDPSAIAILFGDTNILHFIVVMFYLNKQRYIIIAK